MVVETLPQALGMFAVESDPVILPLGPYGGGRVEVAAASDDAGGTGVVGSLCAATGSIRIRARAGQRGSLLAGVHPSCVMPARR